MVFDISEVHRILSRHMIDEWNIPPEAIGECHWEAPLKNDKYNLTISVSVKTNEDKHGGGPYRSPPLTSPLVP